MKGHIVFDCDGTLVDTSGFRYALYPGIKELLRNLAPDYGLYVWTARDRVSTQRILKELGVFELFENLCTVDDALPKPHVAGLAQLVGSFSRTQICVIGDTSNDILGARSFGVRSVGAGWNSELREGILLELGVDFIAKSPALCGEWLRQQFP